MELAGGPPEGRQVKVFWPGGSSAPVLPESMLDTHTDMEALAAARSMGGSGGVIVMDDTHCVVKAAYRLLKFYAYESCGKWTPWRVRGAHVRADPGQPGLADRDGHAHPRVGRPAERPLPVRARRLGRMGHRLDDPPLPRGVRGPLPAARMQRGQGGRACLTST